MVHKLTKIVLLSFISFPVSAAFASQATLSDMIVSGSLGYTNFSHHPSSTFAISDYDIDSLHGFDEQHYPNWGISAKKKICQAMPYIDYFAVGPAIYYQKSRFSGDVWETLAPDFNNYKYRFMTDSLPVLLEGDIYFKPLFQHLVPFVSAGLGFSINDVDYKENAVFNIDPASELNLNNEQTRFAYNLGAGLAYIIDAHWFVSLRYSYMHLGRVDTGTSTQVQLQEPIRMQLNSQNIFFALNYVS